MLFNSYEFIFLFLPISFFIYFYLNSKRLVIAAKSWLVFSSLFFYSWWDIAYLPLILTSILFNYTITRSMLDSNNTSKKQLSKKALLYIGLGFNIGFLSYFKYMDFFISNFNGLIGTEILLLHLALPLAISFFTLQQIAFIVDSYRGLVKEKNFLDYTIFVTFFPQLIAGPIVHHSEMMPQFASLRSKFIDYSNIAKGLFIFSIGLFKKVVIADTLSVWVSTGFDTTETLNLLEAWVTSLAYTFQLYFDFSGYTDMAIGAALLFNIKLPVNFNSPYKASSIQDFWRRWHITLSRFLKEYVYIPLGGNRKTEIRTYTNLFTTFLIGGIWHGAAWTFVLWGALHGAGLIIQHIWQKLHIKLPTLLAWFITFNFINISWVFFRAESFDDAMKVLRGMAGLEGIALPNFLAFVTVLQNSSITFGHSISGIDGTLSTFIWILAAFILVLLPYNSNQLTDKMRTNLSTLLFIGFIFITALIFNEINQVSEFIYFNF